MTHRSKCSEIQSELDCIRTQLQQVSEQLAVSEATSKEASQAIGGRKQNEASTASQAASPLKHLEQLLAKSNGKEVL